MSAPDSKTEEAPAVPAPVPVFPPPGQVVAIIPSNVKLLPSTPNRQVFQSHRQLKIHMHGFHCSDYKDSKALEKVTMPEEFQAEVFFRKKKWYGEWVPGDDYYNRILQKMPDQSLILEAMGAQAADTFGHRENWDVKNGQCPHGFGSCLYVIVYLWLPQEMFAKGGYTTKMA